MRPLACVTFRRYTSRMKAHAKPPMTVSEFLDWNELQEGKYELVRGQVYAMAPGTIQHARSKAACWLALSNAIKRAGLPCEAFIDGPGIALSDNTCYIPGVSVHCGERVSGEVRLVPNPVIVIEVLSPSTERLDKTGKLADYFTLPGVQHYVIINLERRFMVHHRRGDAGLITTAIPREGELRLDPPGVGLAVAEMFGEDFIPFPEQEHSEDQASPVTTVSRRDALTLLKPLYCHPSFREHDGSR
jgi:Uma2 family endonuclease